MSVKDDVLSDDHQAAVARIQQAVLEESCHLDLSGLALSAVPAEIHSLTTLETLDLRDCLELEDLSALTALSTLKVLRLGASQLGDTARLTNLTPLADLCALQHLDLGRCRSLTDLRPLADLCALQHLDLGRCRSLTDLGPLAGLRALQHLDLGRCRSLTDLGPLAGLRALQDLNLAGCESLTDLRPLAGLRALQDLSLGWCESLTDLSPLAGLRALQDLSLGWCESLTDLGPLAGLTSLSSINLYEIQALLDCTPSKKPLATWQQLDRLYCSQLRSAPSELSSISASDNCLPRLRQWQQALQQGEALASVTKVIIIGNGRVGKTQLCRRLQGLGFDPEIPSTHGIDVQRCTLRPAQGEQAAVEARLWDFGGQDIYLGTHSLFLDERAIYVLAWTPEHENTDTFAENGVLMRNRPLSYWLAFIHSAAGQEAPVIVVQTQCDSSAQEQAIHRPPHINFTWFKSIQASAKTLEGMDELQLYLKKAATRELERYGKVCLPQSWVNVAEVLRSDVSSKTVAYERFVEICQQQKIGAPDALLAYLHRSGQVFWMTGIFDHHVVVDLSWAFKGLYSLNHRTLSLPQQLRDEGRFHPSSLHATVWRHYGPEEQALFLRLMEQCQLCFPLETAGFGYNRRKKADILYIAPDNLPNRQAMEPAIQCVWQGQDADAELVLAYPFLHEGITRNALSIIGAQVGKLGIYWKYGACFYDQSLQTQVLIDSVLPESNANTTTGQIVIQARGQGAQKLIETLVSTITQASAFEYEPQWNKQAQPQPSATEISVEHTQPVLESLQPGALIRVPEAKIPVYVSYTWAKTGDDSEDIVNAFRQQLPPERFVLMQDKLVTEPGHWISDFMRKIGSAEHVLVVLSAQSLKSWYCMRELHHMWQHSLGDKAAFLNKVIPIISGELNIYTTLERMAHANYWKQQIAAIKASAKDNGAELIDYGVETVIEVKAMEAYQRDVVDILKWISDVIMPENLDDVERAIGMLIKRTE